MSEPAWHAKLRRLGFTSEYVNHDHYDASAPSGHVLLSRWRMIAHPEVTCRVEDEWEGGGGSTFIWFHTAWDTGDGPDPYCTSDQLSSIRLLVDGVRDVPEPSRPGVIDLRPIRQTGRDDRSGNHSPVSTFIR